MSGRLMYIGLLLLGALGLVSVGLLALLTPPPGPQPFVALVPPLCFYAAGAVAAGYRPDHRGTRRVLAVGALHLIALGLAGLVSAAPPRALGLLWSVNLISMWCYAAGFAALGGLFVVFPDGEYHRRYERLVDRGFAVIAVVIPIVYFLSAPSQELVWSMSLPTPSTYGQFWTALLAPASGLYPAIFLVPLAGLAVLVLRYRRVGTEQRIQMRWPLSSAVALVIAMITTGVTVELLGVTGQGLVFIAIAGSLPVTIVIGMLRHRLFDIDLIIRRSLVYGALWLAIASAYVGLTALLGIAAGQRLPIGPAIVLTIIASMLFQPARVRLERLADSFVYGSRLSGYELLRQFGSTVAEIFYLDDLVSQVVATVQSGLSARWVRLSLYQQQPTGQSVAQVAQAGTAGEADAAPALAADLSYGGVTLGVLECGPRHEDDYSTTDRDLLAVLARQAALAIRNALLASDLAERIAQLDQQSQELAASRARLVQAADAERRRIERDLHDGVQQQIVALMAQLQLVRMRLRQDPQAADAMLADIQTSVQQTHSQLRELVHGIHPAVLSDRGLVEAVEAAVSRVPLRVSVAADLELRALRFAAETEAAAYFLVAEGLTNIMKHSSAAEARVRLRLENGTLCVEVSDSGAGFDTRRPHSSGLRGLEDRLQAVGGRLTVVSAPGEGTRLVATLPALQHQHA